MIEALDDDRQPRLTAFAYPWRRGIEVDDPRGRRTFAILRRRLFPLTGRFDVLDAEGYVLGALNRNGRVRDGRGRVIGTFRDDRRFTREVALGAAEALANVVAGLDGTSAARGPTGYVWVVEGRTAGWLGRARMPTPPGGQRIVGAGEPARAAPLRWARKIAAALGRPEAPPAWKFVRSHAVGDERLLDAAAICAIELTYW